MTKKQTGIILELISEKILQKKFISLFQSGNSKIRLKSLGILKTIFETFCLHYHVLPNELNQTDVVTAGLNQREPEN